jgi:hypothetical protein
VPERSGTNGGLLLPQASIRPRRRCNSFSHSPLGLLRCVLSAPNSLICKRNLLRSLQDCLIRRAIQLSSFFFFHRVRSSSFPTISIPTYPAPNSSLAVQHGSGQPVSQSKRVNFLQLAEIIMKHSSLEGRLLFAVPKSKFPKSMSSSRLSHSVIHSSHK